MRGGRVSWRNVPAVLVSGLFLVPVALMLAGAVRDPDLPPPRSIDLLSAPPTLEAFHRAEALAFVGRAAVNSLVVAAMAVPLAVLVASAAGFGVSRLSDPWRRVLIGVSVAALMVPATALLVPRFTLFRGLDLTDTWIPLLAPALIGMSPVAVLLYAWAFGRLSPAPFEAARLEGVSTLTAWWRYGLPQVRPVTATVATLAFVASWNNTLDPLVYLYDATRFTLPLSLRALAQLPSPQFPVMLAGAVVATVPIVVAVIVGQRFVRRTVEGW